MMVWNLRPRRLACAVALCLALAPTWPALGGTILYRNVEATSAGDQAVRGNTLITVGAIEASCGSIAAAPDCGGLLLLAEVSALGFACLLLKRRKAELTAFRSWLVDATKERSGGRDG
jgi:hypothetical protein